MEMRNITLSAVVVLILVSLWGTAYAQDGSLTVANYYNILPTSSSVQFSNSFHYHNNVTNITTAYFFTSTTGESTIWAIADVGAAVATANISGGDPNFVKTITVPDPTISFYAGTMNTKTGELYMASSVGVYRIFPNSTVKVVTTAVFNPNTASASQQMGVGYFLSGFDQTMYMFNFTTGNHTTVILNTTIASSSLYVEASGYLFVGGSLGDMEKFNTRTGLSEVFVSGDTYNARNGQVAGTTLNRAAMVYSNRLSKLYVCTQANGILRVDVMDPATLNVVANYSLPYVSGSTFCGSIALDDQIGQLFVGLGDSGASTVFAYNLVTQEERDFTVLISDVATSTIITTIKDTKKQAMYFVTGSQIAIVDYLSTCPADCSSHGACIFGNCSCYEGWVTEDCSSARCEGDCYGNGQCANGVCVCEPEWTSSNCSVRQCQNACSGHGTCSGAPDWTCTCTGGWSDSQCSTAPPPPPPPACEAITTLTECVGFKGCGWCEDNGKCRDGSIMGPYWGSCANWTWDSSPEIGVTILAAIFLAILGLMFLFNAISAIRIDFRRAKDFDDTYTKGLARKPSHAEASALWWRDQRSTKTWLFVEQLQFLVLVSHLALEFPTTYINFTRYFDWTNFGLPLPFNKDENEYHPNRVMYNQTLAASTTSTSTSTNSAVTSPSQRSLLGFETYSSTLTIDTTYLFGSNLFWVAIATAAVVVVYQLLVVATIKKLHWRTTFMTRMVYLLVRLFNMAYVGIVMTSSYAMVSPGHSYRQIAPSVIVFILFGIGYPLLIAFILRGDPKKLLQDEFKYKFGGLYTNYRPGNRMFVLVLFARKFVTAAMIGFLNYSLVNSPKYLSIVQVVIMGVIQIGYAVVVFIQKPYYDYYHEYLEYFLSLVNLATLGLSMWQYNSPSQAGMLITGLVQTLGVMGCVGVYIVSWIYMNKGESNPFTKIGKFFSRKNKKPSKLEPTPSEEPLGESESSSI